MTHAARIPFFQLAPTQLKAMIAFSQPVQQSSIGERLVELIKLRVLWSTAAACVDMHWRHMMKRDIDPRHLNALSGWRGQLFFNERERAALGWAEAVNALPQRRHGVAFAEVKRHFDDNECARDFVRRRSHSCLDTSSIWASRNQIPKFLRRASEGVHARA